MTNEELYRINVDRLKLICPTIRARVEQCLTSMFNYGERPLISKDVWRSPELQLQKFNQGVSRRKWGYHCATLPDGSPGSLAADIISAEHAWFDGKEIAKEAAISDIDEKFWFRLGWSARRAGLDWGGLWFDDPAQVDKMMQALNTGIWVGLETKRDFGWDVAHVEVHGVYPEQARDGWRIWGGHKMQIGDVLMLMGQNAT